MKKSLLTVAFVLASVTAFARPVGFKSCTADEKPVTLVVEVADGTKPAVVANIAEAFEKAASALPAERLVTSEGFRLFVDALSDEAKESTDIPGPPAIHPGSCKVQKAN